MAKATFAPCQLLGSQEQIGVRIAPHLGTLRLGSFSYTRLGGAR